MKKFTEFLLFLGIALLCVAVLIMLPLVIVGVIPTGDEIAIAVESMAGAGIILALTSCVLY